MRTRTVVAALLAASLLALTGCGTEPEPDAEAKPTPTVSPDEKFLAAVDEASIVSWTTTGPTDTELLDYPQRWCAAFTDGHSADHVLNADQGLLYPLGDDWGTKRDEANELLVLATKSHCPDLTDQVTADLRATGAY
ncbi:DUF732 domain-containing protein [Streptomyces sp. NPDC020755]|uniref:DUF732 domain-containing protein n=1 Tax=Streptomyces sp. NPDC020755 TaxID=3154790 RepID=UPI0033FA1759